MADVQLTVSDLISTTTGKSSKIFTFVGQIDESSVMPLVEKIYAVIKEATPGMGYIFDLENLLYMNSKSVGYMTDFYNQIKTRGGNMVLTKLQPNINDILSVIGLTRIIPVAQTLEEAKNLV